MTPGERFGECWLATFCPPEESQALQKEYLDRLEGRLQAELDLGDKSDA